MSNTIAVEFTVEELICSTDYEIGRLVRKRAEIVERAGKVMIEITKEELLNNSSTEGLASLVRAHVERALAAS